jgi:hypothetical protein
MMLQIWCSTPHKLFHFRQQAAFARVVKFLSKPLPPRVHPASIEEVDKEGMDYFDWNENRTGGQWSVTTQSVRLGHVQSLPLHARFP